MRKRLLADSISVLLGTAWHCMLICGQRTWSSVESWIMIDRLPRLQPLEAIAKFAILDILTGVERFESLSWRFKLRPHSSLHGMSLRFYAGIQTSILQSHEYLAAFLQTGLSLSKVTNPSSHCRPSTLSTLKVLEICCPCKSITTSTSSAAVSRPTSAMSIAGAPMPPSMKYHLLYVVPALACLYPSLPLCLQRPPGCFQSGVME